MKRRYWQSQKLALPYVLRTKHPAVFMQMRLGKTPLVIRRCQMYVPRDVEAGLRVLIVGPNSALGAWETELKTEGETDYVFLQGTRSKRLELLQEEHKWNIINKEGHRALPEIAEVQWDVVILDESTFIKNPKAQVTKFFLKHFRNVAHRWILTGLPNPESDLELWCQLAFLDGYAFGCRSYWDFRSRFFKPGTFGYTWTPKLGTPTKIKQALAKRVFILQRDQVNMDVPKVYERRIISLPRTLQQTYNTIEKELLVELRGKEITRTMYEPVKLVYLRQLCEGYIEKELVWRGKFIELVELINGELVKEQVVVWFSYNHSLQHAYQYLKEAGVSVDWADGSIPPSVRRSKEKQFNAGKFRVYLLQVKIGDAGMNLSCSDTAIYFTPPFGSFSRQQSEDRILRADKKGPLLIIDLCIEQSVDTALLDSLQERKFKSKWTMQRVVSIMEQQRKARGLK